MQCCEKLQYIFMLYFLQNGGECLRAYVSVSPDQVCNYHDSEGHSGLWYLLQVSSILLNPTFSEFTATFIGRFVVTLITKTGNILGENVDLLLKAVLSKMQTAETIHVLQVKICCLLKWNFICIRTTFNFLCNELNNLELKCYIDKPCGITNVILES